MEALSLWRMFLSSMYTIPRFCLQIPPRFALFALFFSEVVFVLCGRGVGFSSRGALCWHVFHGASESATLQGGILYCQDKSGVTIFQSQFMFGTSILQGGAVAVFFHSSFTCHDCSITNCVSAQVESHSLFLSPPLPTPPIFFSCTGFMMLVDETWLELWVIHQFSPVFCQFAAAVDLLRTLCESFDITGWCDVPVRDPNCQRSEPLLCQQQRRDWCVLFFFIGVSGTVYFCVCVLCVCMYVCMCVCMCACVCFSLSECHLSLPTWILMIVNLTPNQVAVPTWSRTPYSK